MVQTVDHITSRSIQLPNKLINTTVIFSPQISNDFPIPRRSIRVCSV